MGHKLKTKSGDLSLSTIVPDSIRAIEVEIKLDMKFFRVCNFTTIDKKVEA
jgi:hypothetical protein